MTTVLIKEAEHVAAGHAPLDVDGILAYRQIQVVRRYAAKRGVSQDEAGLIFQETKKFLATCALDNRENYSPSEEQDAMWHEFILFTRDYVEFCQTFFGRYLHHIPCDGKKVEADPCPLKNRAAAIFGEITPRLWPGAPSEMARCCGMC